MKSIQKFNNFTILLVGGKANSGKDTFTNYLVNKYSFKKFAFADELKNHVSYKYNINKELFFSQEGKKTNILINNEICTIRKLLIKEALEKKRNDENYWVNIIIEKLKKLKNIDENKHYKIIISDFRFPNEFYELYKICNKVTTINVIRNNGAENIDDISEKSLNNFHFDYLIYNNSSIEDFYTTIDKDLFFIKR